MKLYEEKVSGAYTGPLKGGIGGPIAGAVTFPKTKKAKKK